MSSGSRVTPVDLVNQTLADTHGVIAVTGATGWFGSVALDLLYGALGEDAPRRVAAYASNGRDVKVADGRTVHVAPLADLVDGARPSGVLHFAYLTPDRLHGRDRAEFVVANLQITGQILAAVDRHRPDFVVVASSGAVYTPDRRLWSDVVASPYGFLKHLDERVFRSAAHDAGATCVIPRIFSVGGPRMPLPSPYALGEMTAMAATGGPIEVHARHEVYRSYCGVDEVVALVLWCAVRRRDVVFDTCGEAVEMGDLARRVAAAYGLGPESVRRELDDDGSADVYVGDESAMLALADEARLHLRTLDELIGATTRVPVP